MREAEEEWETQSSREQDVQAEIKILKEELDDMHSLNSISPLPKTTRADATDEDTTTSTTPLPSGTHSEYRSKKAKAVARINRALEANAFALRGLSNITKFGGKTEPLFSLDALPYETIEALETHLLQFAKLGVLIDTVLLKSLPGMSRGHADEYRSATTMYGDKILNDYVPGAFETVLSFVPESVIRLFAILRVNASRDNQPFTEQHMRERIDACSTTSARGGRPQWERLLNVLSENQRTMGESYGAPLDGP